MGNLLASASRGFAAGNRGTAASTERALFLPGKSLGIEQPQLFKQLGAPLLQLLFVACFACHSLRIGQVRSESEPRSR